MSQRRKTFVVAALGGCLVLFISFVAWVYYGPNPHKVSKYARTEWSKNLEEVGLASVPRNARYFVGPQVDGPYGNWSFTADAPTTQRWLSDSRSIQTAEVKTKPGKRAYLISVPSANKVSVVVVKTRRERCFVMVEIVDLVTTKGGADSQGRAREDPHQVLYDTLDDNVVWSYSR